jgi:hypothetical protein
MQTSKINIELMNHMQLNKELVFNEAMIKIDSLMNLVVEDFMNESDIRGDQIFIIQDGDRKNSICYFNVNSDQRQYFLPKSKIVAFVAKRQQFYMFDKEKWSSLSDNHEVEIEKLNDYINISGQFSFKVSNRLTYFYVTGDTQITLQDSCLDQFTIIIKQNATKQFSIEWLNKILWPAKQPLSTMKSNSINMISFYKLPNENTYLARLDLNYQY